MDALVDGALQRAAIVAMGRRAIASEAEALWALAHDVGEGFVDAITILWRTSGLVVTCGLGKSGQIGQKIASTLASTGTPAAFMHAGDAVHGELGSLMRGDTLIILSNSGDTREFGVIMRRAHSLGVPIIAITSSPGAPVANGATVNLLLPVKAEACPFGSSPTTSTTMMLALGDALAIALMQMRGIQAADLLELHPGGRLGLDLVRVESFMHGGEALPLVRGETPMEEVLKVISEKGFGIAGVIDGHRRLDGVITDGDIRRSGISLGTLCAKHVMTARPRILEIGAMARDALTIMSEARITAVFVLQGGLGGHVRGVVHIHDLLRLGIG